MSQYRLLQTPASVFLSQTDGIGHFKLCV